MVAKKGRFTRGLPFTSAYSCVGKIVGVKLGISVGVKEGDSFGYGEFSLGLSVTVVGA